MSSQRFNLIRRVLLRDWDPIGITAFEDYDEDTDDEYNGYARSIENMKKTGCSIEEIVGFLSWAEENMGLQVNEARVRSVAGLIAALDVSKGSE